MCVLILLIVFMPNISPPSRPGKPCPNLDQSESKDLGWCQFHPYDLLVTQNDIPGDIWSWHHILLLTWLWLEENIYKNCILVKEILATAQVSDTEEDDFSETAEHLAEIKEAPASVDYHPNQTFPFLKDLDISTVYRWDKNVLPKETFSYFTQSKTGTKEAWPHLHVAR